MIRAWQWPTSPPFPGNYWTSEAEPCVSHCQKESWVKATREKRAAFNNSIFFATHSSTFWLLCNRHTCSGITVPQRHGSQNISRFILSMEFRVTLFQRCCLVRNQSSKRLADILKAAELWVASLLLDCFSDPQASTLSVILLERFRQCFTRQWAASSP